MKQTISYISTILIGITFLISGFAKAWVGNDFADIVLQYGFSWLPALVPALIAIELLLAMALLLRIYPKYTCWATSAFLVGLSLFYLYGVLFRDITDCGCFGPFHQLSNAPWKTFVRNGVLLTLAMAGAYSSHNESGIKSWKVVLTMLVIALSTFVCGLSMSQTYRLPQLPGRKMETHITVEQLGLDEHFSFDADTTYVVYLFSYTCSHCQNSYANVEQYQRLNLAQVYGLAVANPEGRERFMRIYEPTIPISEIEEDKMSEISNALPVLLIIRNGEVVNSEVGHVTAPGIFQD